ncbi:MAG: carboxylesterase family protein [Bacteroidetes bacterium]|nr:carboxylesterase family protein [Bacteroidota bacterium]
MPRAFTLLSFFSFLGLFASLSHAQCPENLLIESQYSVLETTEFYASNTNLLGDTIDLLMDIYAPDENELEKRPVLVLAFGGSFTSGSRDDLIMPTLSRQYAAKGWVVASIDYRLFPSSMGSPDSLELIDANMKAVSDMKAAVRYFRQSADNGNPYRVDPDFIVVGGYSAGAFTGVHAAMIDENDVLPMGLDAIIENNGGLLGNTGSVENQSYPSDIQGVLSFAGAVFDTTLVDATDPPIASLHGLSDNTVPVGRGQAVNTVTTFGSQLLHQRADQVGLNNVFQPISGAGHIDIWFPLLYQAERDAFTAASDDMFRNLYCDMSTSVELPELENSSISIAPNPVHSETVIYSKNIPMGEKFALFNAMGQSVFEGKISSPAQRLDLAGLSNGLYWLRTERSNRAIPISIVK